MFDELDYNASTEDFMALTIKTALEGKHQDFEFITCLDGYWGAELTRKALTELVKSFRQLKKCARRDYKKSLKIREEDLQALQDYNIFTACEKYYTEEALMVKDSMQEYLAYLFSGHLSDVIMDAQRSS